MCHKQFLHLLVIHFPPLIVTTNPGGDDTCLIQTVVSAAVCSVPCHNTVAGGDAGDGIVAAVGGDFKTPAGAALLIVPY